MTTTTTPTLRHALETPVFIAAKNKTCEPYNGEPLPFKKIPVGALVKGFEASITWYAVEVFTGGKIYRAKIKNFALLNRAPVQDWPNMEPDAQPVEL